MLKLKHITNKCLYGVLFALFGCFMAACSDDNNITTGNAGAPYDASKPVTITDFTPKSGPMTTKLIVYGDNFGNDSSLVKVYIGGKRAPLVSVHNNALYCFVPAKAFNGDIKVEVGDEDKDNVQEAVSSENFDYTREMVVGTLCGKKNKNGDEPWSDGSFKVATGFKCPGFFKWDPLNHNKLYVCYDYNWDRGIGPVGIQCLNLATGSVSTIMGNGMFDNARVRSMDFTLDGKYMIVAVDNDANGQRTPVVYIVTRNADGNFDNNCERQTLAAYKQCNGASVHPINGEVYFNSFEAGQVFRLNLQDYFDFKQKYEEYMKEHPQGGPDVPTWQPNVLDNSKSFKQLYTIQDRNWEFKITIHPSGKYAYINVINQHYILRTDYDETTKQFAPPYIIAGDVGKAGWEDKAGKDARFNQPYQGIFVKNPEYEKEGKQDVYDYYIAERGNHDIRKITPEGIVSTFAGRGSRTSAADNNIFGNDDGSLRDVARFNKASGIAYDERTNTFYVVDEDNHLIRTIGMETDDSDTQTMSGQTVKPSAGGQTVSSAK